MTEGPVFIVSTGRTGTRFFARLFAEYGLDVSAHHTTPRTRPLNVLTNMAYLKVLPQAIPDAWLRRIKAPEIAAAKGRYVECNPYYFGTIPAIRGRFPDSRFVFLTRHPRDFAISHIRWERQRLASRAANQLIPFWGPVGYHEQILGLLGDDGQRVRYYAKVWTRRNETILAAIEGDDRATRLRFEDVFGDANGSDRLLKLFEWLGMPLRKGFAPGVLGHRLNESAPDPRMRWDRRFDEVLRRECGPLMVRLGYQA